MHPAVQFHEELAASWEDKYKRPAFRSRERLLKDLLRSRNLSSQVWLDAGCGTGTLSRVLADGGAHVRAVDASPAMIKKAAELSRNHAGVVYETIDNLESINLPADSFDGILCSSVLEYLDHPERALTCFFRLLRPGGLLICSVPNRQSLLRKFLILAVRVFRFVGRERPLRYLDHSQHSFSVTEIERSLARCGFSIEKAVLFGEGRSAWLSSRLWWAPLIMVAAARPS